MPLPDRIVLIGFMASGKSTVGRMLAARLGRAFVDTDSVIERHAGKPVARIFAEEGEEAFRDAEAAALREVAGRVEVVVATGGGAPVQPGNAWFFAAGAATFHLRVSLAATRERTRRDRGRPLLQQGDEALGKLRESRLPRYEELGAGVDTDGRTPAEIVQEILKLLGDPTRSRPPGESA